MITMGGNAEIELIDSMDPFSEGKLSRCSQTYTDEIRGGAVDHAAEEELAGNSQSVRRGEGLSPFLTIA